MNSKAVLTRNKSGKILAFLCIGLFLFDFFSPRLFAQTKSFGKRQELENERKSLEKQIQITTQLLTQTQSQSETAFAQMKLLGEQIKLREQLMGKIQAEISVVKADIKETQREIDTLEAEIGRIQYRYGQVSYAMYKTLNRVPPGFYVMSAKTVNDGYNRARYFKEFSRYAKSQMELIKRKKAELELKKLDLDRKRMESQLLANKEKQEQNKLEATRKAHSELYTNLKKNEAKYKEKLKEKRKALENLKAEINRLIEEETRKLANVEKDILLPLSNEFKENKGKLPWPLPSSQGLITTKFGVSMDDQGISVNNNGIDITTGKDQAVRAVFQGKVSEVSNIPFYGKVIILQHGSYFTVYTHLQSSEVEKGQMVEKLQRIGVAKTDKSTGETKVHFQIFKDREPQNPAEWIVNKR